MNISKHPVEFDMWRPEVPTHCRQCGDIMVHGPIKPWVQAYNLDGTPNGATQYELMCNKQSTWWKRLTNWSYHEEFLVIDHPQGDAFRSGPTRTILTTIRTF